MGGDNGVPEGVCSEGRLPSGLSCCGKRPFNPETTTCCKVYDGHSVRGNYTSYMDINQSLQALVAEAKVPGKVKVMCKPIQLCTLSS